MHDPRSVWRFSGARRAPPLTAGAFAKDLPADAAGAKTIADFLVTYGGKTLAAAPGLSITPDGTGYVVALDLAALNASVKALGVTYAPAIVKYHVVHQDDGAWRIDAMDFPVISASNTVGDKTVAVTFDMGALKGSQLIDPAISWVRSGDTTMDRAHVAVKGPGIDENIQFGAATSSFATKPGADGALTTTLKETLNGIQGTVAIDPKEANPKAPANAAPVNTSFKSDALVIEGVLNGLKSKPLTDLWAFLVAHPTRPELADNEAAFKTLLTAALATQPSADGAQTLKALSVQTPQGVFAADSFTFGGGVAATGPTSRFEERFGAMGLKLPPGIVPAMYADFTPSAFDISFKVGGFDLNAAGLEATTDMHLAGDAPPVSKEDNEKVFAKLTGAGPVTVEIPPSHIVAPQLDLAFEGKGAYVMGGKPTGALTVHIRNFDKTMTALKGLGPDMEKQLLPTLAMAKGLAKPDGDGLKWVAEIGADGVIKVNGLPLGKSPF